MKAIVDTYVHRTGEHCASTALRNVLGHEGLELSEGMVFGLASGLGFFYLRNPALSPSRMFHGRTATLENDLGLNTGIPLVDREEPDDARAWQTLRERIDAGTPVMISTDTFYLGYHNTTSHFPGHRCVVVGYDDDDQSVLVADRKFDAYQRCSYDELRQARNARDYGMSCHNQYGDLGGEARFGRPHREAILAALARTAHAMLAPDPQAELPGGIPAMRALARELPDWCEVEDWSWAARFGYQVVIKRGAGGSFFRSLYADFLRESVAFVPELAEALPAGRMDAIAAGWCELAVPLKEQSERETCDPALFAAAGSLAEGLADAEERFFEDARRLCQQLDAPA